MHCFELRYKVKETSHYNLYLTINVTLYCNTQIYNTSYLAQRSVSPCSNRMEARSFHLQVSPSGKTCVSLEGSDEPRRLKPIRRQQIRNKKIPGNCRSKVKKYNCQK